MTQVLCNITDCGYPAASKGMCGRHFQAWNRTGDPLNAGPARKPPASCSVEGCPQLAAKKGMCNGHYLRERRGKDLAATPVADRGGAQTIPRGTCIIQNCGRTVHNVERQLCKRHYHQAWKYGDPNRKARLIHATWEEILTLVERNPDTGCIEWKGYTNKYGYGYVTFEGERRAVHHLFWIRVYGEIDSESIHHMCYVRNCVNIAHLEPKSLSENTKDMLARRWANPKPLCDKHDPSETTWYSNGRGKRKRQCRACQRERQRTKYAAKKAQRETIAPQPDGSTLPFDR